MRLTKSFFIVITIAVLVGFFSTCSQENANEFRFVFMTDIHVQPELGGDKEFKQAIASVNSLQPKPDFVIMGGDLVMDVCKQNYERADTLYKLYIDACKNFAMPVYHCIGNHELFGLGRLSSESWSLRGGGGGIGSHKRIFGTRSQGSGET